MTDFEKPSWDYKEILLEGIENKVLKITSEKAINFLRQKVCSFWEESINDILFPGPQPVSIERKDFYTLKNNNYVVCAKLDGERYFLYYTKIPSNFSSKKSFKITICVLVDRNLDFYIVSQNFMCSKDILLDGELMDGRFVIHDTIVINGDNYKKQNWFTRWDTCNKFLQEFYSYNDKCQFSINLKKFYKLNQVGNLFKEIKDKQIKSDGIVFYPMDEPLKYKQQDDLFKWKPPGHHTIDFCVEKNKENNYDLFVYSKGKNKMFGTTPEKLMLTLGQVENGTIVECKVEKGDFVPVKIRSDKKFCNGYYTARKTMLNARENITQQELNNIC
ncbi:MAG: hypothetical protein ACJA1D_001839 [Polaribacter sp.]|jgi:hypothetical protein